MADYTVVLLQYVVSKVMTSRAEQNRFLSANNQILITQNVKSHRIPHSFRTNKHGRRQAGRRDVTLLCFHLQFITPHTTEKSGKKTLRNIRSFKYC